MTTENQNPRASYQAPTRELRIEGERTATMFALATQVSKLDAHLRNLATVPTMEARRTYREATEKFQRMIGTFEDALHELLKDSQVQSRRGGRQQNTRPARPITQDKQGTAENAGQSNKPGKSEKTAQSKPPQEKNPGTQQQPPKPQQHTKTQKPGGKPQQPTKGDAQERSQQPTAAANVDTQVIEPQAESAQVAAAEVATSASEQPAVAL